MNVFSTKFQKVNLVSSASAVAKPFLQFLKTKKPRKHQEKDHGQNIEIEH